MNNVQTMMMKSRAQTWACIADGQPGFHDAGNGRSEQDASLARLSAVVQRKEAGPAVKHPAVCVHDVVIHPGRREVLVDGNKINLTPTEFGILQYLAKRPGWVFRNKQILEAVRGFDTETKEHSLTVHMTFLRRNLGHAGKYIETVPGVGYRLRASEEAQLGSALTRRLHR